MDWDKIEKFAMSGATITADLPLPQPQEITGTVGANCVRRPMRSMLRPTVSGASRRQSPSKPSWAHGRERGACGANVQGSR